MTASWPRLLTSVSAVDSEMPYNWNWQRRWVEVSGFLSRNPLTLIDVGARGEAPPELASLRRYVRRVGFEADPEECRRLAAKGDGIYFPELVAAAPGRQTINFYRDPGYSSTFTLSRRYQQLWSGPLPVVRVADVPTITLDAFLSEHPDLAPDMLKLDTQGSELSILRGAPRALASIGLVEVETEFTELYDGQPLFGDVAEFMRQHDFELLYLNRVFASRGRIYEGPSRGQLIFGDALFGKRQDRLTELNDEQRLKYVILLCQYGHLDIAWQVMEDHPALDLIAPGIRAVFRPRRRPVGRGALMQLDKALAVALHLRRYNQRGTDSDRAWPIR